MSHDGVPTGQKIPLRVVPHEIAQPRYAKGGTLFSGAGPLPLERGEYVAPRNVVLEFGAGEVILGNGNSFQVSAGSISMAFT